MRQIAIIAVAALFTSSCDSTYHASSWLLGGKERRILDGPVEEGLNTSPAARLRKEQRSLPGHERAREPSVQAPSVGSKEVAKPTPLTPKNELVKTRKVTAGTQVLGTGTFTAETPPATMKGTRPREGSVTLNFVDADVRDVIKTVLGNTLGYNFAIDPKVRGTMTLQTTKPIPRSAVLSTLESALSLSDISIVKSDSVYRVVPANMAARNIYKPRVTGTAGTAGEAYGVEILPLKYAAAGEMAKILLPLVPSGALIRTDTFRNLLIVGGTQQERETIADIVSIFDVDWLSGMSFALLPLQFAEPQQAIADLEHVFGSSKEGPMDGLIRFYPVERRQSILVVSAKPALIERAKEWVKRLDVGGEDQKRLYVYAVQNARATDLATILGQVFSNDPVSLPSHSVAPGQREARLFSPPNRSPMTSTTTTVTAQAVGPPVNADQATSAPAAGPTGRLGGAAGPPHRPSTLSSSTLAIAGQGPDDMNARIIADDVNNALVILAKPSVWRMMRDALHKLDVVPLQVMIEATIVEVTLNDALQYGVQSFFTQGASTATFSTAANGAVSSIFPGFSYIYDQGNIRAILNALDSITDIRVISSPQILVLDNRTAELQVGDQVPITTQQTVSNVDPNAPTVNSVQFRDTGVVLRVTPRVNASGVINLEIEQEESSAVATTTSNIDSPTIQQRKLKSTVVVNSGETVALGGLIRNTRNDSVSGIPLLSSIPLFGSLFSSTNKSGRRTELLALITPRVIRNQEEARAVTRDLRNALHNAAAMEDFGKKNSRP